MDKIEFFKLAVKHGLHTKRAWVLSAFSIAMEAPDKWKSDPYYCRVVRGPSGIFFVNEEKTLTKIERANPTRPLFRMLEPITLEPGFLPNVNQETYTTLGNVFFNACALVPAFGAKIPFQVGHVNGDKLIAHIAANVESTPRADEPRDPKKLYIDEYIKFSDSFGYLTEFNSICVWALTKKIILPPPGAREFRAQLAAANADSLSNPTTIARMDAAMVKFDAAYLKGDPGENFLISGKSRNTVRKKLFLMYGAEAGLSRKMEMALQLNSLYEGWELDKFPDMVNTFRAGSFDRGSETQLGGETTKWLLRASSNIRIKEGSCNTNLGKGMRVSENNVHQLIGRSIVTTGGHKLIVSKDDANAYLGKKLMLRSPMFCRYELTDYCRVCVGENLAMNKDGVSMAVTAVGSGFMLASLKSMHAKELKMAKMDLATALT